MRKTMHSDVTWLFDLDNTLYPPSCRLFDQVDRRMGEFVQHALGLDDPEEARRVQKQYLREHGTTLRGLMDRHGVAPEAYLAYVHAIDLSPVPPAPDLDGGQHAWQQRSDNERRATIEAAGFRVVRVWNNDVLTNLPGILENIVGVAVEQGAIKRDAPSS